MKNKAVMKMAKMAGDSRTAMKMKNEAAMKMKKQSAMKMKDPMDMKKDPMMMKKEPMKMKKEPMKMKKGSAMDMKKDPMKMKKNSAMKKKADNIPSPRVKAPSEAKDRNHPKHKQWVEENLIKYGPGSNKPYTSYEDYLANRDNSPKTMKKGAMKMAKKSPMKKDVVDMTSYAKARREKARLKKEREDKKAKATKFVDMTGPARAQRERDRLKKEREEREKRAKKAKS